MSIADVMMKSLALAKHQLQNYTGRRCPFFCPYCGDNEMIILPSYVDSLELRISELEARVAALTNRAKNAENETAIYKEENETLREQVAVLTKERDELREEIHERSNKAMRMLGEVTKERDYWRGTFHLVEKDGMRGLAEQLAAAQAENVRLREALAEIRNCNVFKWLCFEKGSPIDLMLMRIDEALALSSDTTALQARLKEERERCAKYLEDHPTMLLDNLVAAIRSMK